MGRMDACRMLSIHAPTRGATDYCYAMASVLDEEVVKNIIEGNYTL